jgi:hypothetical protein
LVSTEQSRAFYIDLWTTTLRLMNEVSFADAAAQAAPANAFGRTDSRDARIGEVVTALNSFSVGVIVSQPSTP